VVTVFEIKSSEVHQNISLETAIIFW
jgi:hypothetical protein